MKESCLLLCIHQIGDLVSFAGCVALPSGILVYNGALTHYKIIYNMFLFYGLWWSMCKF